MSIIRMATELYPIESDSFEKMKSQEYNEYKLNLQAAFGQQIGIGTYQHLAKLVRKKYGLCCVVDREEPVLLSPTEIDFDDPIFEELGTKPIVLSRGKARLDLQIDSDYRAFLNLFYSNVEQSMINLGYNSSGHTYYLTDKDLAQGHPISKDEVLSKIQDFIHVFAGFYLKYRLLDNRLPTVQIQPKCVVKFEKDLSELLELGMFSRKELTHLFPMVTLPIGRTAKMRGFWKNKRASEPITEDETFQGLSFIQFAKKMYPNLAFQKADAILIVVVPTGNRSKPWYFSSEKVTPSVAFTEITNLDYEFQSYISAQMKLYSAEREDLGARYYNEINGKLTFFETPIQLGRQFSHKNTDELMQPEQFSSATNLPVFFRFPRPTADFKDAESDQIRTVSRSTGHYASPGDLKKDNRNVRPLDVPKQFRVHVLMDRQLEPGCWALIHNLLNGYGKCKSFYDFFGSQIIMTHDVVDDFVSQENVYSEISPEKYDCVFVVGPRTIKNDPIKTKEIYTFSETQILNRGVPVQFISDAPSRNPKYDSSLISKSSNPNVLFGVGLNVLGKIGANVMKLSPQTTNYFLPNSAVIGYNVARIFEPQSEISDTSQEKSPKELVRKSTPLAAPIVILRGQGDDIIQQYAYEIEDESALFSGENGRRIILDIEGQYDNIIVHKDGEFYPRELQDLKNLQQKSTRIIPVSVTTGFVPRLFSFTERKNRLPLEGTVFKLSDDEFIMSTTLVTSDYDVEHRGWPNPIMIRIHDEILETKLTTEEKLSILYQIWCFTRLHIHSELPLRRPLSVHYSNRIAEFLRKCESRRPQYFKNFMGKKNSLGYTPRIFL